MLKKIVLYGPAIDNAGQYRDSGTELSVASTKAEETKAGFVSAEEVKRLVDTGCAVSATEAAAVERAAESA
jgi:hypothetical protein